MAITLLSEDVINKIAAGEVVERPASVVKELVENSLDAGATSILVEIVNSGKELIRITDNGSGMSEDDARKSILRHATSKIKNAEDLFCIASLGFRGEALASIAAVSRLTLTTKQKDLIAGFNLCVEGGQVVHSGIIASDQGTIMEVRDLFFNTPARKKFLKTDAVELKHIIDVVTHYALINSRVSFRLIHNRNELFHSSSSENMRGTIASIYGVEIAKELLEVAASAPGISIGGFVCKPYHARNDKHQQALFVNGRWIKNADLAKAVYDGYHALLFVNKHPLFVINLGLDPRKIDVNVHPQKSEIRIEQKEVVCTLIAQAVREALQKHALLPTVDVQAEPQLTFGLPEQKNMQKNYLRKETYYPFEPSSQKILCVQEMETASYGSPEIYDNEISTSFHSREQSVCTLEENQPEENINIPQTNALLTANHLNPRNTFPELKLLGQVHKTFFVAETKGGVFFIDQHAAHERVMYEQLMAQSNSGNVEVQQLLQSEVLELTPAEAVICHDNLAKLETFGFHIEAFGRNSFLLKTAPVVFGRQQVKSLLMEILHRFEEKKSRLQEIKEEIITRMACRAAVMAGEELTNACMEKILAQLRETKFPYTCPHGRPTLIKTASEDLEKKFKRKG